MVALIFGMLVCIGIALAVVGLVAIPARRDGRELLTARGEEMLASLRERTENAVGTTVSKAGVSKAGVSKAGVSRTGISKTGMAKSGDPIGSTGDRAETVDMKDDVQSDPLTSRSSRAS